MAHHHAIGGIYGTESDDQRDGIRIEAVARAYRWNKIPNRGGRTLVNGTGYDVKLKSGETWYLNTNPQLESFTRFYASFTSNGEIFNEILVDSYMHRLRYIQPNGDPVAAYSAYGGWANAAYRTITFDEEPTGELLTWLEANGTRV